MKSLKESLILELSSELLARAHNKQVARNGGKESNRSRRFATAAGKALRRELLAGTKGGTIVNTAKELSANSSFMSTASKDEVVTANNISKETKINIPEDDNSGFYIPNGYYIKGDVYLTGAARKINASDNKFYIYRDMYHSCLHIACANDIKCNIGYNYNDFEDFSQKDILGEYNSAKDAVKAALNMLGYSDVQIKKIPTLTLEDYYDNFEEPEKKTNYTFYDHKEFYYNILTGIWGDADCFWSQEWYSVFSTLHDWANVYTKDGRRVLSDGTIEEDE